MSKATAAAGAELIYQKEKEQRQALLRKIEGYTPEKKAYLCYRIEKETLAIKFANFDLYEKAKEGQDITHPVMKKIQAIHAIIKDSVHKGYDTHRRKNLKKLLRPFIEKNLRNELAKKYEESRDIAPNMSRSEKETTKIYNEVESHLDYIIRSKLGQKVPLGMFQTENDVAEGAKKIHEAIGLDIGRLVEHYREEGKAADKALASSAIGVDEPTHSRASSASISLTELATTPRSADALRRTLSEKSLEGDNSDSIPQAKVVTSSPTTGPTRSTRPKVHQGVSIGGR